MTNSITELLATLTAIMITMLQPVPAPENDVTAIDISTFFMGSFSQADNIVFSKLFFVLSNQHLIVIIRTIQALMIVAVIDFNPDSAPLCCYQLRQFWSLILFTPRRLQGVIITSSCSHWLPSALNAAICSQSR